MALHPECDAMIGAFVMARMSQNDFSAMWDTSTMMPRRFISATACLPRSDRPLFSGSRALDESASWLLPLCDTVT